MTTPVTSVVVDVALSFGNKLSLLCTATIDGAIPFDFEFNLLLLLLLLWHFDGDGGGGGGGVWLIATVPGVVSIDVFDEQSPPPTPLPVLLIGLVDEDNFFGDDSSAILLLLLLLAELVTFAVGEATGCDGADC